MASFQFAYIKIISGHEGGYSNDPADRGGETYKGISRKQNPDWAGWKLIDKCKSVFGANFKAALEKDEELQNLILSFYKNIYWDVHRCDAIASQDVANELFDISVNMGAGTAAKFMQQALNLLNKNAQLWGDIAVDGKIGQETLSILNICPPASLIKCLNGYQWERYKVLCEKDHTQEKFFHGWLVRT